MAYEVLRVVKVKDLGAISRESAHLLRERDEPHIDREASKNNVYRGPETSQAVVDLARERLSHLKTQKHCVAALEYVVSYGEGKFKTEAEQDQFFAKTKRWLEQKHGKENLISFAVHRDEQTPHLHAMVIPVRRDAKGVEHLSAAHYVDGRKKLSDLQTEFHEGVGKEFGLDRGVKGSKALHQDVKRYRTLVREAYKLGNEYQKSAREIPPFKGEPGLKILTAEGRQEWQREVLGHYEKHFARLTGLVEKTFVQVAQAEAKIANHASIAKQLQTEKELHKKTKAVLEKTQEVSRSNIEFLRDLTKAVRTGDLPRAEEMMRAVESQHKGERDRQAQEKSRELERSRETTRERSRELDLGR